MYLTTLNPTGFNVTLGRFVVTSIGFIIKYGGFTLILGGIVVTSIRFTIK